MRHAAAASSAVLALCLATTAACTATEPDGERSDPTPTASATPTIHTAQTRLPSAPATVLAAADAAARAVAVSQEVFVQAPVAVLAPVGDVAAQVRAAAIAVALGAPVLLAGPPAAPGPPSTAPPAGPGSDGAASGEDGPATGADEPPGEPTSSGEPAVPDPVTAAVTTELERLGVLAVVTVGDVSTAGPDTVDGVDVHPAPAADAELSTFLRADLAPAPAPAAGGEVAAVAALDPAAPALPVPAEPADGSAPTEGSDGSPATEAPDSTPATPTTPGTASAGDAGDSPLPLTEQPAPLDGGLVLTTGDVADVAALATARAAGLGALTVPSGDPRVAPPVVDVISAAQPTAVIGLGPAFGDAGTLEWKVATAATGVELPGGGQVLFPGRRLVALYGSPVTASLGLLGEQDLDGSLARVQALAAEYQALTADVVVPAFELIVTVASGSAGDDGNYSNEWPVDLFVPWVEAARDAGVYVIIDLQPGRTDFLTQAQQYEALLRYPNVGLALDPEWRLEPDQVHLRQIGSVAIEEVNAVVSYLADLTRRERLPQKLLVLHQFSLRMIEGRERLDTSRDELSVMIHADGQGSQGAKAGTWQALRAGAPEGITWGWKNFIDEDVPMLTPAQTYAVEPVPELVTYQ